MQLVLVAIAHEDSVALEMLSSGMQIVFSSVRPMVMRLLVRSMDSRLAPAKVCAALHNQSAFV